MRVSLPRVSPGRLPEAAGLRAAFEEARAIHGSDFAGAVVDDIPARSSADPGLFGLALAPVPGAVVSAGDKPWRFRIPSVSRPFVFALVYQAPGEDEGRRRLGVNATGLPFDPARAACLPPRDGRGHSVRGRRAVTRQSNRLGLPPFVSRPATGAGSVLR